MNHYTVHTIASWLRMPHDHVWVDERHLREDAILDARREIELPRWDTLGVYPVEQKAFMSHLFWHCVVNFAFAHFDGRQRDGKPHRFMAQTALGKKLSGAFAMGACFYRVFKELPILARDMRPYAERMQGTKEFFRGYNSMSLLGERRMLLREACEVLEKHFAGNPLHIWEEGGFCAYGNEKSPGIVDLLIQKFPLAFGGDVRSFPFREGESRRGGDSEEFLTFPFHKKAHLLTLLYQARAEHFSDTLRPILDIDEVGPAPDYILPRSYAVEGIFRYSDRLQGHINYWNPIEAGSQMELELRGATVWAQVMECAWGNEERRKRGLPPRHMGHIDSFRGGSAKGRGKPHFLCKTTAY